MEGKKNRVIKKHILKPPFFPSNHQFSLKFFNFKILSIEVVIFMAEMLWIPKQAKWAQQNLKEYKWLHLCHFSPF